MIWLLRILPAVAMAGILIAAAIFSFRRHRRIVRSSPSSSIHRPASVPSRSAEVDAPGSDEPLLSPLRFTVSHFSLLVILLAMMGTGLAMRGIRRYPQGPNWHVHGGDVARGKTALRTHGCVACHMIPGISEATGEVGPPLNRFSDRMYIAGQLPNTPEHLIAWIRDPQHHAPGTAMPDLAVGEEAARDMAAYLYGNP